MTFEQIKTPDINNDGEINGKDLEALSSFSSGLKDDERDIFIGILEQSFLNNSDFRNSFLPLIRKALNNPNIDQKIKEIFEKAKYETELSIIRNINEEEILEYLKVFYGIDLNIEFQFIEENERKNVIKRFLEDLKIIFSELGSFNTEMIGGLRKIRENMSFGAEKGKSDEYYKGLIIGSKIKTRITILLESVKTMYGEKISVGGIDYNKKDYEGLEKGFRKLDENFGINLFGKIPTRNFKSDFAKEIRLNLDKSGPDYNTIVAELNRLPQIVGNKGFERLKEVKLKNGNTVNLEDLYNSYNSLLSDFSQKNKVFYFGKMQAKNTDKGFGFEQARYNLGFDSIEEIYQEKLGNIDQIGFADLVIMLRLIASIIPIGGDIIGGIDDLNQANSGINFDGSIQGIPENILMYITGILGITIVGGVISKIAKGPKLAKILAKIPKILERLRSFPDYKKLMENENFRRILGFLENILEREKTKNEVFDGGYNNFKREGSDIFSTNKNFTYRFTGFSQIEDIVKSGYVRAPEKTNSKTRSGKVYWTKGGENEFYHKDNGYIIQVRNELIPNGRNTAISIDEIDSIWFYDEEKGKWIDIVNDIKNQRKEFKENGTILEQMGNVKISIDDVPNENSPVLRGKIITKEDNGHFSVFVKKEDSTAYIADIQIGYDENATRGKGYGLDAYIQIGNELKKLGYVLESTQWDKHLSAISPQALRVWEKLVEKGYAEVIGKKINKIYNRETGEETIQETNIYRFTG